MTNAEMAEVGGKRTCDPIMYNTPGQPMTNAEMAEVAGVSVATIKRWDQEEAEKEEGPHRPRRPRSRG